jgi:radical SAM protein with 4Fe4S-binding SPASM domain
LEWGERFDWPDPALPECPPDTDLFCYGLRDQIGILVDGTVVPCCLDADANLALGNLFESELDDILASPRAKAIYDGFTRRRACESLCRKCGYARRFSRG